MKKIICVMLFILSCTSCAATNYEIPDEYDLKEDCSEWNTCNEESEGN